MNNWADVQNDAKVIMATCCDEQNPPDNIIDGDPSTFWTTTGAYPQEIVIAFSERINVQSIELACLNVRKLSMERCSEDTPKRFTELVKTELDKTELDGPHAVQRPEMRNIQADIKFLKITIHSGWGEFAAISSVAALGR